MKIKVFFNEKGSTDKNSSFSPSAGKPAALIKKWKDEGFKIEVENFKPLLKEEISLAHDPKYVEGVLELKIPNGFDNYSQDVAKTLPYTSGNLVAAARYSFTSKNPSVSLTSGFHHAGYSFGGGFCTFNALVIAARVLNKELGAKRVGILDLDMHYGNGTDNIISELKLNFITHYTFGGVGIRRESASNWLKELPKVLEEKFKGCDIILFQAGADPHINDPLGGVLTTSELRKRDRIVFKTFRKLNIPVAWNLAGGYQKPIEKVLEIHTNTLKECLNIFSKINKTRGDGKNEEKPIDLASLKLDEVALDLDNGKFKEGLKKAVKFYDDFGRDRSFILLYAIVLNNNSLDIKDDTFGLRDLLLKAHINEVLDIVDYIISKGYKAEFFNILNFLFSFLKSHEKDELFKYLNTILDNKEVDLEDIKGELGSSFVENLLNKVSINKAHELYNEGRFSELKKFLLEVIEFSSNDDRLWTLLGISLVRIGDVKASKRAFLSALKINPKNSQSIINYITSCFHTGDKKNSILSLKTFFNSLPEAEKNLVLENVKEAIKVKLFTLSELPKEIIELMAYERAFDKGPMETGNC